MNFNLFAQEEAPQKSMKITIEINEDGKTSKKTKELNLEQIESIDKLIENLEDFEDFDVDVSTEALDIFLKTKLSNMETAKNSQGAFLGVYGKSIDESCIITGIVEGSAAEKVGLKEGDKITKIETQEINSFGSLAETMNSMSPGTEVKIEFERDGENKTVKALLGKKQRVETKHYHYSWPADFSKGLKNLGEGLETIDKTLDYYFKIDSENAERAFLGITKDTECKGVVVGSVIKSSTAEEMGLKKGDEIVAVDKSSVESFQAIIDLLKTKKPGESISVEVNRDGKSESFSSVLKSKAETNYDNGTWDKEEKLKIIKIRMKMTEASEADHKLAEEKAELKSKNKELKFKSIEFRPNPTAGKFGVSFETESKKDMSLRLIASNGSTLYEINDSDFDGRFDKDFDITEEASGTYYLIIDQGNSRSVKKIVKN